MPNNDKYQSILQQHDGLKSRKTKSEEKLVEIREEFTNDCYHEDFQKSKSLSVFCGGSIARGEIGEKSDLDLFITTDDNSSTQLNYLGECIILADLININRKLKFPEFSNGGEYLKIHDIKDMIDSIGSRIEDSNNDFTVRLLMMLESQWLYKEAKYKEYLKRVVEEYYREHTKIDQPLRPIFLLNDLLRYWRTLCLNYEAIRSDDKVPWRKSNINLKFSRMLTVFSTVIAIIVPPIISESKDMISLCKKTPLERLAFGLDKIGDNGLNKEWLNILNIYEEFLCWKEYEDDNINLEDIEQKIDDNAKTLSSFLYKILTHDKIEDDYKRYLVL